MRALAAGLLALSLAAAGAACGETRHGEEEVRRAFAAVGVELSRAGGERFVHLTSGEGVDVAVLANEPEARAFADDAEALLGLAEEAGVRPGARTVARRLNVVAVHEAAFEDEVAAALARLGG